MTGSDGFLCPLLGPPRLGVLHTGVPRQACAQSASAHAFVVRPAGISASGIISTLSPDLVLALQLQDLLCGQCMGRQFEFIPIHCALLSPGRANRCGGCIVDAEIEAAVALDVEPAGIAGRSVQPPHGSNSTSLPA